MHQARFEREVCLECLQCVAACPNDNLVENYGIPGQKTDSECQGCMHCVKVCPTKAIQIEYVEEDDRFWTQDRLGNIRYQANSGEQRIKSCGCQKNASGFDQLLFLPAQLRSSPLLEREEVDTSVIIGEYTQKPFKLNTPILIGAMSFGALSKPAKIALARATRLAGSMANTGEGGMLPEEREEAQLLVVQYSTGRFGITEEVLKQADMVEIKIGQGAKPGLGGHLLKAKVTPEIAKIRGVEIGKDLISPSRHPDINSPDDLRAKVNYLREASNGAPVAIKIAAGNVEEDLEIAVYAEPDVIFIDGLEGGTGAAPIIASDHFGIPTLYAVARAAQFFEQKSIKTIKLGVGGGLRDAADFGKALALGADLVYIGTSALIAMGCRMCRACHKGICPVGIATQNELYSARLDIDASAQRVSNFLKASTHELQMIARMVGKDDLAKLDRNDMRSLDTRISKITGVKEVYESKTGSRRVDDNVRNSGSSF